MHQIQIAALGSWVTLPHIQTPFTLVHEVIDPQWQEDLIQLGWDQKVLMKADLKKIRQQSHVIWAELSLTSIELDTQVESLDQNTPQVDLSLAKASADLLKTLSDSACVLYFDPSMKVMTPHIASECHAKDPVTLLHMFIDFWGDQYGMYTSGMQVFALPDLHIQGDNPQSAYMQATVFSAAAHMVCEDKQWTVGDSFQASESFPNFTIKNWKKPMKIHHSTEIEEDGDQSMNPFGVLCMQADQK
jgi:hypothetical protein